MRGVTQGAIGVLIAIAVVVAASAGLDLLLHSGTSGRTTTVTYWEVTTSNDQSDSPFPQTFPKVFLEVDRVGAQLCRRLHGRPSGEGAQQGHGAAYRKEEIQSR